MKPVTHIIASLLLLVVAVGSAATDLPDVFRKTVPSELRDGLKLVEVKKRCDDCAPWRVIDFRDHRQPQPARQEKVSVRAGFTAMYAFPGTGYFANTKVEQSMPGVYDQDKAVVIDAIRHEYARKQALIGDYLTANPKVRDKVESLLPKGKQYVEFEEATYKGAEYVAYTENVIGLTGATISQLQIFVPNREIIVTAYLLKQKNSRFSDIDEFLKLRRDFLEGYIDFLSSTAAIQ